MPNLSVFIVKYVSAPVLCLIIGITTGYKLRNTEYQIEQAKILKEQIAEQKKDQEVSKQVVKDFFEEKQKVEVVHDVIEKEIIKYIPAKQRRSGDCNPTHGAVRLLNQKQSSLPESSRGTTQTNTGVTTSDEGLKHSEITEEQLIKYTRKIKDMYEVARLQCNSLIKWNEEVEK